MKPRYDKDENISRHGAVSPDDCYRMEKRQNWKLKRIEETPNDPVSKVDCVFEGETEFPNYQED